MARVLIYHRRVASRRVAGRNIIRAYNKTPQIAASPANTVRKVACKSDGEIKEKLRQWAREDKHREVLLAESNTNFSWSQNREEISFKY